MNFKEIFSFDTFKNMAIQIREQDIIINEMEVEMKEIKNSQNIMIQEVRNGFAALKKNQ